MNKIIYIAVLLVLGLSSCYEDKGHYDYKKINEVTISGIKDQYDVNVGDHLLIEPELSFKLNEKADVSYRWRIDTVVISESKVLDIDVTFNVKTGYYMDFSVIDNESGITYMKAFKMTVSSEFRSGWLLLSEKDNAAKLDFITEDGELMDDIYYNINNKHLPVSCRRMTEDLSRHYAETAFGQIILLSDEGVDKSVSLDGASFGQVVNLEEEFIDGKAPEGLIPMAYGVSGNYRYIVDQNGKVYSKYAQKGLFQEGYFNQFPVMGDYKVLPVICETWYIPMMSAGVLMFDVSNPAKGNQYVFGMEDGVMAYDTTRDSGKKFDLIGMDKEVLAMGPQASIGSGLNNMSIFLKSNTGNKYFVQSLGFGLSWGRTPWMKSNYETEFPDPSIVNASSVFAVENGRERIYIGTGSKLYMYDMQLGEQEETSGHQGVTRAITPLKDFGAGKIIRSIYCGLSRDRGIFELGVAVENGNKGDFYLLNVSSEGIATPWECAVFKSFEGVMGRPYQVRYKMGDLWRFN